MSDQAFDPLRARQRVLLTTALAWKLRITATSALLYAPRAQPETTPMPLLLGVEPANEHTFSFAISY